MVFLDVDTIGRTSSVSRAKKNQTLPQYLNRLTHLYFAEKDIEGVGDLSACKHLSVVYLYDNTITEIGALGNVNSITHLYLQNNNISRIDRLDKLKHLSKLYLGGNSISVVEGLESCRELQELHIDHQRLPVGEKILFSPRTLSALSDGLNVLNISANNLSSLQELKCLRRISQLDAGFNRLTSFKELDRVVSEWPCLWRLELSGNPLCKKAKYRDRIIAGCRTLSVLDGKEIPESTKLFLSKWKAAKERQKEALVDAAMRGGEGFGVAPRGGAVRPPVTPNNMFPGLRTDTSSRQRPRYRSAEGARAPPRGLAPVQGRGAVNGGVLGGAAPWEGAGAPLVGYGAPPVGHGAPPVGLWSDDESHFLEDQLKATHLRINLADSIND